MNTPSVKKFKTNQLFPRSSFLTGMGSVLNISGKYFDFNYSKSEAESDAKAIASDWGMVGQDLQHVLDTELPKARSLKTNGSKERK